MSNTLVRDAPNFVIPDVRVGLSLDQLVRDAPNFVIPAKSLPSNALIGGGNPVSFSQTPLGPRFRGTTFALR